MHRDSFSVSAFVGYIAALVFSIVGGVTYSV